MGDICKDRNISKAHISSRIEIACEHGTLHSQPERISADACTHHFYWRHDAACPRDSLSKPVATAEPRCQVKDPRTGYIYDFNSLKKQNGQYEFEDEMGQTWAINICAPTKDGRSVTAGATFKNKNTTDPKSLGKFNEILKLNSDQKIYLIIYLEPN